MNLVIPEPGLIFWQLVVFLGVFLILRSKAWGPIVQALKDREKSIEEALMKAKEAEKKTQELTSQNEAILAEARIERDKMIAQAQTNAKAIVEEARAEAQKKAAEDLSRARQEIATEKAAAMSEIKNLVASLSLDIAEKVLRQRLAQDSGQQALVQQYLSDLKINQN